MGDSPEDEIEPQLYGTKTLRLLLIGMAGTGKSATGNMIAALDKDVIGMWETASQKGNKKGFRLKWNRLMGQHEGKPFVSGASSEVLTQEPRRKDFVLFGKKIAVVDTPGFSYPGFGHTNLHNDKKMIESILGSMYMLSPGPNAIVLVMGGNRLTLQVNHTIKGLKEMFGPDLVNFLIIVFTGMDNVTRDGLEIDDFVQELQSKHDTFRDLLEQVDNRWLGFDNTLNPFLEENKQQVQKLVEMAKQMAKRNNDRCYNNELIKHTYTTLRDAVLLHSDAAHALALKEMELRNAKFYIEKLEKQNAELTALLKAQMKK